MKKMQDRYEFVAGEWVPARDAEYSDAHVGRCAEGGPLGPPTGTWLWWARGGRLGHASTLEQAKALAEEALALHKAPRKIPKWSEPEDQEKEETMKEWYYAGSFGWTKIQARTPCMAVVSHEEEMAHTAAPWFWRTYRWNGLGATRSGYAATLDEAKTAAMKATLHREERTEVTHIQVGIGDALERQQAEQFTEVGSAIARLGATVVGGASPEHEALGRDLCTVVQAIKRAWKEA